MPRAHPADIGILILTDRPTERPAAFFALDQRGEKILVALPFMIQVKCLMTGMEDLLSLLKHFLINDLQFRPLRYKPFRLILSFR